MKGEGILGALPADFKGLLDAGEFLIAVGKAHLSVAEVDHITVRMDTELPGNIDYSWIWRIGGAVNLGIAGGTGQESEESGLLVGFQLVEGKVEIKAG